MDLSGICMTCTLAPTCSHRLSNPGLVVWECEEFDSCEMPRIRAIVEKHSGHKGALMSILGEIQGKYGFLPRTALRAVSEETNLSLVDVYGVATFYKAFSLKPRGRHLVSVCLGTACHVRGGPGISDEIQDRLGVGPGDTTPDREFTLETVNCLGACAIGPVVVVDGHYFPKVSKAGVKEVLAHGRDGFEAIDREADDRRFPLEVSCPRCNHTLMDRAHSIDGHPAIRVTVSSGREHGWLLLSSIYGSYEVDSEYEIPGDAVVNFFCPHCHTELRGASACPECGVTMVPMLVRGGGVVQICPRRGCRGHLLDLHVTAVE